MMDPSKPESFNHRTEKLSTGRKYHFVDQKPDTHDPVNTVTLLLVHGFPDLWYGWKYQIGPWVKAGYRVVVPDMLGYGGTDQPKDVAEYSTKKLSDDLAALLDLIGVQKAVLIGHDWGSFIVGRFALWHPDRLLALVNVSVAFTGGPGMRYVPLEQMVEYNPNFGYMLYFSDDASTREIDANIRLFFKHLYRRNFDDIVWKGSMRSIIMGERPVDEDSLNASCLLSDEELSYFVSQFTTTYGPLCYYRTTKVRFEEEQGGNLLKQYRDDLPVLFIRGEQDPTSPAKGVGIMRNLVSNLKVISLNTGHWVMLEKPERFVEEVLLWLSDENLKAKM